MLLELLNNHSFLNGLTMGVASVWTSLLAYKTWKKLVSPPDQEFHFEVKDKGVESIEGGIRDGKIKTLMPAYETKTNRELMDEINFRLARAYEHLDMVNAANAVVDERIASLDKFMRYQQQVEGKPILQQLENRDKVR